MKSEDDRFERRLRTLRPIGPTPALRARVLVAAGTRPRSTAWLWLPAAAALFAAVLVGWRTTREYGALGPTASTSAMEAERTINQLSREWGDTAASRAAAAAAIEAIEQAGHQHRYVVSAEGSIK